MAQFTPRNVHHTTVLTLCTHSLYFTVLSDASLYSKLACCRGATHIKVVTCYTHSYKFYAYQNDCHLLITTQNFTYHYSNCCPGPFIYYTSSTSLQFTPHITHQNIPHRSLLYDTLQVLPYSNSQQFQLPVLQSLQSLNTYKRPPFDNTKSYVANGARLNSLFFFKKIINYIIKPRYSLYM